MPREQVRGANRQKRVASVTHSSRLLLPNPRNVPPTRQKPPPARRYPSRVTRFLAPLEAGSLDGPKNEAANVLQVRGVIAATSRPGLLSPSAHARDLRGSRATLPNPTGRSTRGHGATRLSPTRTFGLPPLARRQTGKREEKLADPSLFPAKHLIQRPRFSEPARGISRRELVSPVTRVPLPLSPVRASDPQQPSASPPPRARPNRVPRTHERSR